MSGVHEHPHASVRWFPFWLTLFSGQAFSRLHIFLCNFFGTFRAFFSVFMTPLTALIEHVISGFLALTQGVDALHRMIWHDMALADDTQPISTIGRR
jgi:hypothetical protein